MKRHVLVVGAQRCGTTTLSALLDAHPDIAMARPSRPEPKVFLSPEVVQRGRQWYEDTFFAHATTESVLGEKSTSYLEHPDAAARAAAVLGAAHIVVQLRDPVARAVSNWRFSSAHGLEHRPLGRALEANLDGPMEWDRSRTSVSPYAYLERGRYVDYLAPWLDAFPATVHVGFLEELATRDGAVTGLYEALGVDPGPLPADSPPPAVNRSEGDAPDLGPELMSALRRYFEPANQRLSDLLGRDLPWWAGQSPAEDTLER